MAAGSDFKYRFLVWPSQGSTDHLLEAAQEPDGVGQAGTDAVEQDSLAFVADGLGYPPQASVTPWIAGIGPVVILEVFQLKLRIDL